MALVDKAISIAQMTPVIEEMIGAGKSVEIFPRGISMSPTIQNGDVVILKAFCDDIKKYDVVLYKRNDGTAVLHRVCALVKSDFVMAGDAQSFVEYPVKKDQIVGIVTSVLRNGKIIYDRQKRNLIGLFLKDVRHLRAKIRIYAHVYIFKRK